MAGLILLLRTAWPGFTAWQPQAETFTPADKAGQSLVLELDHPAVVNFTAAFAAPTDGRSSGLHADVMVRSPTPTVYQNLPVRTNRSLGQIQVFLDGVRAHAGDEVTVRLFDSQKEVLLGGTEHDSYAPGSRVVGEDVVGGDLAFRVVYRRTIASLVLEGLRIAFQSRRLVLAVVIVAGAAGLLVTGALRQSSVLDLGALFSAGISGGLLFTSMIGLAAAILHLHMTPTLVLVVTLLLGFPGAWLWFRPRDLAVKLDLGALGLVACLLLFGALRFAFASPLVLPTHVDSVQEYLAVADMLAPDRPALAASAVGDLSTRYYHLGFHATAAWVLGLAGGSSPYSLLVLGQMIQAALIAAVYFPVYAAVKHAKAALAAVALAGLGWSMPAYASNWAKYPALLGLAVLPLACGLTLLAMQGSGHRRLWLVLASSVAVIGAVLIHSRMLFLFGGFILSLGVARRLKKLDLRPGLHVRTLIPIAIILLVATLSIFLAPPAALESVRLSMATFFDEQGTISTAAVLILLPLALWHHRTAALATIASIASILFFELLPPNAPYPFPIIDAPLARMALFLPLCCLGGLGVSGLESVIRVAQVRPRTKRIVCGAVALVAIVYVGWTLTGQTYSAGECCVLARQDDVNIARSASVHLPKDSLVLIPSQASVDVQSGPYPVDGGAWLLALAGRRTVEWPAADDLTSASEHSLLCSRGVTHIYAGGTPWGFSRAELDLAPAFYAPNLMLPGAAIYSVIGCAPVQSGAQAPDLTVLVTGTGSLPLNCPPGSATSWRPVESIFDRSSSCRL